MKNKPVRPRIGIKYCGGCNPHFDRVALVRQIEERLEDSVVWVSPVDGEADLILAVQGCPTACADLSSLEGLKIWIITNRETGKRSIRALEGAKTLSTAATAFFKMTQK